ncbi:MAG: adenosylcobinamide-GDP ribazoletransferase [Deltaproteobacteria bacterium]|nr:adenosylcobinamide-GDP ribazoletransferase [Deltaproteobacteria bacterium]
MKRLIIALQFLTIFPVKRGHNPDPRDLAASMAWFPVVGALLGAGLALLHAGLAMFLPASVVSALLLLALAISNGGLHLDGFSDTIDGIAGGRTPEDRLRIMKDSAIGATGAAFLIFLILVKYLCLNEIPGAFKGAAVFFFPIAGRWAMVLLSRLARYARPEGGSGSAFAGNKTNTFIVATIIAVALAFSVLGIRGLAALIIISAAVWASSLFFKKKLGGVTGDVFGFTCETSELILLILLLAFEKIPAWT